MTYLEALEVGILLAMLVASGIIIWDKCDLVSLKVADRAIRDYMIALTAGIISGVIVLSATFIFEHPIWGLSTMCIGITFGFAMILMIISPKRRARNQNTDINKASRRVKKQTIR